MKQCTKTSPQYKQRRIGTLQSLQASLGIPLKELLSLAECADNLYRHVKVLKPDGNTRDTYDALKPLKKVHRKIKTHILDHVVFPPYLTGSIKGCDYKVNAALHAKSRIVINEDIKNFFPTTSAQHVFNIWYTFFGFSKEVAQCLTLLTTRKDQLPQGTITSPFLANLVFWQDEFYLYNNLASNGIIYSRYVDDIAASSKKFLTNQEKTKIIQQIYGMLFKYHYHPKREKHEIATSAKRIEVTKLSVNNKPGLSKKTQSKIRASVHYLEQCFAKGEIISYKKGQYPQVMGQVMHLARFHPGKAATLINRLFNLKKLIKTKNK